MKTKTSIHETILQAGAFSAHFHIHDTGVIQATLFGADGDIRGKFSMTRLQMRGEQRRGLLCVDTVFDKHTRRESERWGNYILTIPGNKPVFEFDYPEEHGFTPGTPEYREIIRVIKLLHNAGKIRAIYGVGGTLNKVHRDDWPLVFIAYRPAL